MPMAIVNAMGGYLCLAMFTNVIFRAVQPFLSKVYICSDYVYLENVPDISAYRTVLK